MCVRVCDFWGMNVFSLVAKGGSKTRNDATFATFAFAWAGRGKNKTKPEGDVLRVLVTLLEAPQQQRQWKEEKEDEEKEEWKKHSSHSPLPVHDFGANTQKNKTNTPIHCRGSRNAEPQHTHTEWAT